MTKTHRRPMAVATAVLVTGVAASLAGNLQAINLDNAEPGIGAYVSAVLWPLFLFGVVELLIHTPWLATWRDNLTKLAVVSTVGAVAAWVSYWHQAHVLSEYGYDVASRYTGPVAIDAAMVLAALALDRVVQARRVHVARPLDMDTAEAGQGVDMDTVSLANGHWVDTEHGHLPAMVSKGVAIPTVASGQAVDMDTDVLAEDIEAERKAAAVDIFERLARDMATVNPTLPVPVSPAPMDTVSRAAGKLSLLDGPEASDLARIGRDNGLTAGEIAELLAGWYGVSTRTMRRQAWWTPVMKGQDA